MSERDGYKMTELGEIPVDWGIIPLKNTAKVVTGKTPATQTTMFWDGNIPWITPSDIDGQRDIFTSGRMLSAEGFSSSPAKLPPNTVLVTCIASIGKNAITRTISSCNQQINAVLPNPSYNCEFLYYWISNNKDYYVSNAAKTAVMILNKSTFENLSVVLPPLPEQLKIADILSTVDEHISETESLIEKTKVLKQGMMQQLLTKGIGHTEFKDTEIGRIPVEWNTKAVTDVANFINGYPFSSENWSKKGTPIVRIQNLNDPMKSYNYTNDIIDASYRIAYGDLLLSWSGTIGVYIWKGNDAYLNQHIYKVLPNDWLDKNFFKYALNSVISKMADKAHGSTMQHITKREMSSVFIALPDLPEQQKIASLLTSIDDQIDSYQTKFTSLTKLKSALMQQLLTGKTRVKI